MADPLVTLPLPLAPEAVADPVAPEVDPETETEGLPAMPHTLVNSNSWI